MLKNVLNNNQIIYVNLFDLVIAYKFVFQKNIIILFASV